MSVSNSGKVLKGISTQTFITIVMGVCEMVVFSLFSRFLSKEDFGYFASLSAVLVIFNSLSQAGIGSALVQKKTVEKSYIDSAFTISFILGVFFSLVLFFTSKPLAILIAGEKIVIPLAIMSIVLLLHNLSSVASSLMLRKLSFFKLGCFRIIPYVVGSGTGIFMAYYKHGVYALVTSSVSTACLSVILLYSFAGYKPRFHVNKNDFKSIVSFGGWLTLSVIASNISHQVDKLVLSRWLSVIALGAYNRPSGFITNICGQINGIFDTVLFPILSQLQDDVKKVRNALMRSIELLNVYSILLFSVFFFNTELIINIFFGKEWLDIVNLMRVVSVLILFNVNNRLWDCFYRGLALVKQSFYIRGSGCLLIILGIYIGVHYGIMGVAVSVLLCKMAITIAKAVYICKKVDVNFIQLIFKVLWTWKLVIFFFIEWVIYYHFLEHAILFDSIFAVFLTFTTIILFLVFPKFVSTEYHRSLYSKIISRFPVMAIFELF